MAYTRNHVWRIQIRNDNVWLFFQEKSIDTVDARKFVLSTIYDLKFDLLFIKCRLENVFCMVSGNGNVGGNRRLYQLCQFNELPLGTTRTQVVYEQDDLHAFGALSFKTFAGVPPTTQLSGMSFVTTAFGATKTLLPIVIFPKAME